MTLIEELTNKVAYLEAESVVMKSALREIVACDYRGNMPHEQSIAKRALERVAEFRGKFFNGDKLS
jgi:hypothetical protein